MNRFFILVCVAFCSSIGAQMAIAAPQDSGSPTGPASGLDVVLESVDVKSRSTYPVGRGIVNDDARQTFSSAMLPANTQIFLVRVKNTGRNSNSFSVHLSGPLSDKGEPTAWKPQGWTAYAVVDGETKNIVESLHSKQGWATPQLKAGEEALLRLSITTTADTKKLSSVGSIRLEARSGDLRDAVIAEMKLQFITRVEWSMDGYNWKPLNQTISIPALQTVSLRVVTNNPDVKWEDFLEFLPTWDLNEPWEATPTHYLGEMISVHGEAEGVISFSANAGTSISGKIVVTPEAP